jgi:two-component system, OmpR family, response regulator PhoP
MRVLIVEDEPKLARNVARSIRAACGYAIDIAADGKQGLFLAQSQPYDAIVLDIMLPQMNGYEFVRAYRESEGLAPILVLTARDDKRTLISLLNAGADDYLSKPFDLGELLARLKSLVRRGKGQRSPILRIADLELNSALRRVTVRDREIELSPMEYRVLEYLLHRPGVVVSKAELAEHIYDYNWEKFSNVIEVYISGLRKKLSRTPSRRLIHTVRGHGYILRDPRK